MLTSKSVFTCALAAALIVCGLSSISSAQQNTAVEALRAEARADGTSTVGHPALQEESATAGKTDLDSQIEALRADVKADKVAIITEAMDFTPEQSSAFWPIYKQYENEMTKINDQRVAIIKRYADKFTTLTDADAKDLTLSAFSQEAGRVELKKKYFRLFNEKLPATIVAKFFQLEHRLNLLIDLRIASELPSLLAKPSVGTPPGTTPDR